MIPDALLTLATASSWANAGSDAHSALIPNTPIAQPGRGLGAVRPSSRA